MNDHKSLLFPTILGILATVFANAFFPFAAINTLAPLIALAVYRNDLRSTIWVACWLGLILDLLNSQTRFGVQAIFCVIAAITAYSQRRHFYEDKPLAFALFSTLISALLSIQQMIYLTAIDRHFSLSLKMFACDALLLSCLDGAYALIWFYTPMHIARIFQRSGWKALLGDYELR